MSTTQHGLTRCGPTRCGPILWLTLALAALCGCGQEIYRAETRLLDDGRIDRAIYQPAARTPAEAQEAARWTTTTRAVQIRDEDWQGTIRALPQAGADDKHPYFAAWGTFASVDQLPDNFREAAPEGLPDGTLRREYDRRDYGFLVEYRWRETLTDLVILDDLRRARRELADLLIPLAGATLQEYLGEQYRVTELVEWLKTEGVNWFEDATDRFLELSLRKPAATGVELQLELAGVCARYGLELRNPQGQLQRDEALRQTLEKFVGGVLRRTITRRDGQPLEEGVVSELLDILENRSRIPEPPPGLEPPEMPDRLKLAWDHVVAQHPGGEERLQADIKRPFVRIFGLYCSKVLATPVKFHYSLQTPGTIFETNGICLSLQEVVWNFSPREAYPFGYGMYCRSFMANPDLQRDLLKAKPLNDRVAALKFIALLERDAELAAALKKVGEQKTLAPLQTYRRSIPADAGERIERVRKLLRLLQLDPDAPALLSQTRPS